MVGYCTPDDVRKVLQDTDLRGETAVEYVRAAIEGESEWLRKRTDRHWYDNSEPSVFDSPRTITDDVKSIPSSPHSGPNQLFVHDRQHYPKRVAGPYTRVELTKRDVQSLTTLEVRDNAGEVEDWVAASDKSSGRGNDYYLQVHPTTGTSYVFLHTGSLPFLYDFDDAVITTYDYGIDGIPDTISRAVALRAAAALSLDDDTQVGVPDNGQLVNVETKAQQLRTQAEDLLEPYMTTPIA